MELRGILGNQLFILRDAACCQNDGFCLKGDDGIRRFGLCADNSAGLVGNQLCALAFGQKGDTLVCHGFAEHGRKACAATVSQCHRIGCAGCIGSGIKLDAIGNQPVNIGTRLRQNALKTIPVRISALNTALGHMCFPVSHDGLKRVAFKAIVLEQIGIDRYQDTAGQVGGATNSRHLVDHGNLKTALACRQSGAHAGNTSTDNENIGGFLGFRLLYLDGFDCHCLQGVDICACLHRRILDRSKKALGGIGRSGDSVNRQRLGSDDRIRNGRKSGIGDARGLLMRYNVNLSDRIICESDLNRNLYLRIVASSFTGIRTGGCCQCRKHRKRHYEAQGDSEQFLHKHVLLSKMMYDYDNLRK